MKINRDSELEGFIFEKISEQVGGNSTRAPSELKEPKIHGSDLLWCLRKSYYQKMEPRVLTEEEIFKFFKGNVSEHIITEMVYPGSEYKKQNRIEGLGIISHPDIMSSDIIIELKQTDKFKEVDPDDKSFNSFISYCTQILYYMCITNIKRGKIIINHSFLKKGAYQVWNIEIDEHDMEIIRSDILFKRDILHRSILENNVGYLPKLRTIGTDINKCNYCSFKTKCNFDTDLWEVEKINKVLKKESGFPYSEIEKTDVNYLYNTLNILYEKK